MSKLARALIIGAMVAAMNLAVMTTLAHAQANDQPTSNHNTRRPPTEAQVGEPYRHDHDALASRDSPPTPSSGSGKASGPPSSSPPSPTTPGDRTGSRTGSSLGSVCWPRSWRWSPDWS
jgi:hypothetical protein